MVGFFCNLALRPVSERYYMTDEELEAERKLAHELSAQKGLPRPARAGR